MITATKFVPPVDPYAEPPESRTGNTKPPATCRSVSCRDLERINDAATALQSEVHDTEARLKRLQAKAKRLQAEAGAAGLVVHATPRFVPPVDPYAAVN